MTTATAQDTRHIRDALPVDFLRELQSARPSQPTPRKEAASSIKGAIIRWLNEEL